MNDRSEVGSKVGVEKTVGAAVWHMGDRRPTFEFNKNWALDFFDPIVFSDRHLCNDTVSSAKLTRNKE